MCAAIRSLNPPSLWPVPEDFRDVYSHASEVTLGQKMLFISGQFGVRPDATLPGDFGAQAEQALDNVEALLAASAMTLGNVVKLTYYLVRSADAAVLVQVRKKRWQAMEPPAVTVVTVSALARPEYLVEIEAVAVA